MAAPPSDLGVFEPLVRVGGVLAAAGVGIVSTLWGTRWNTSSVGALIRVACIATVGASLATAAAYGELVPLKSLSRLMWVCACIALVTIISLIMIRTVMGRPHPNRSYFSAFGFVANISAVIASSLTVMFGAMLVERTTLNPPPTSDKIVMGGAAKSNDSVMLRGVETPHARIRIKGTGAWEYSVGSSRGNVKVAITASGCATEHEEDIEFEPPSGGKWEHTTAPISRSFSVDIPAEKRVPGCLIAVTASVVTCAPDPAVTGNPTVLCFLDADVSANPEP